MQIKSYLFQLVDQLQWVAGVDFVVEQGSSGFWQYRKWNSGRAECWGRNRVSVNISTEWGSIYYDTVAKVAFPSGLFTDAPMCQITPEFGNTTQAAWWAVNGKSTKAYAPSIMFCRPLEEEANFDILYYANGTWK